MLKNLFKSAKKALKNPIVQLGIGALLPQSAMFQSLAKAAPILSNPAVLQGGIGLLAGDKPIDIARNIGIQSLLGGFRGLGEGGPGFTEGMKRTFQTQTEKLLKQNVLLSLFFPSHQLFWDFELLHFFSPQNHYQDYKAQ